MTDAQKLQSRPNLKSRLDVSIVRDVIIVIAAAAAVIVELTILKGHLEEFFGGAHSWIAALSIAIAAALVAWLVIWPRIQRWYRSWRLDREAAAARILPTQHFQLKPFTGSEEDKSRFDRLDNVHHQVLSWVRKSTEPLLYLSGRSGVGKSSLLHAYVLPQLSDWAKVQIGGFYDTLGDLKSALLTRGTIWDRPPFEEDADLHEVVSSACTYLRKDDRRLLLVFDQFEELTIIHDRYRQATASVVEFLKRLVEDPIKGLTLLVVIRTDYIGKVRSLGLPPVVDRRNWLEVAPFTVPAAIEFLTRGEIAPELASEVVRQGCEIEETPGLIRSITLNFFGVILQRKPDALSHSRKKWTGRDGLLVTYLRHWINDPLIRDDSRKILPHMITSVGTKHPRSEQELSEQTDLSTSTIERCLVVLQTNGLVRRIDDRTGVWEISHDFVAQRLDYILSQSSRSFIQRSWERLPFVTAVFWVVFFLLVPWVWLDWKRSEWENAFYVSGGRIVEKGSSEIDDTVNKWVEFEGDNIVTHHTLRFVGLQDVYGVDLEDKTFILPRAFPRLRNDTLRSLHLTRTWIADHDLEALEFRNLHTLGLSYCNNLRNVDGLEGLTRLQTLNLSYCDNLQNVDGLEGLTRLQTLNLSGCNNVHNVDGLEGITPLQILDLSDCNNLQNVDGLKRLTRLQTLNLSGCNNLHNVDGLEGLTRLQTLNLSYCDNLQNVDGLKRLTRLRTLILSDCNRLSSEEIESLYKALPDTRIIR